MGTRPASSRGPDGRRRRLFQVYVSVWSPATPAGVFALLEDVTTWTQWAGFAEASYERAGDPSPHGVGAVRRLRAGPLSSRETVLQYEPGRRLVYDYVGTLPLRNYRAEVVIARHARGTRITWHATFSSTWPLAGPLLRRTVAKALRSIATRLAQAAAESHLASSGGQEIAVRSRSEGGGRRP